MRKKPAMSDLTFTVQKNQFFGIGIHWNRRNMFDYGWITLMLPFVDFVVEWQPDHETFDAEYGTGDSDETAIHD